jgi:hypothetical protein
MAGCMYPKPDPVPTPIPPTPTPIPVPDPTPLPVTTVITIEGPTDILPNQTATLQVKGVSPAQLSTGKVVWWPRNNIEVLPVQTWGGQPLLMVRSPINNTYLIQVMTAINNELAYTEHIITVGTTPDPNPGPVPPGPVPPDPGPIPPPPDPVPPAPDFEEPLSLILIEETEDRTPEEAATVLSTDIIKFIAEKGWTRYLIDKDIKDKDGKTPESVKAYIERAVGAGLPWYIVVDKNGNMVVEGPIKTEKVLLEVLKGL